MDASDKGSKTKVKFAFQRVQRKVQRRVQGRMQGKKFFITGVGDDQGYAWSIAKALAEAGATLIIGVWVPRVSRFCAKWQSGVYDTSRVLKRGGLMSFEHIYPVDFRYQTMEDVPKGVREHKLFSEHRNYSIGDVAKQLEKDLGKIDGYVHSIAHSPDVNRPLLDVSRSVYLETIQASSYSFVASVQQLGPLLNPGGSVVTLTYIGSRCVIPGYGGGMSSAKAALESDVKVLAFEMGEQWGIRVNAISANPLRSSAGRACYAIDALCSRATASSPLRRRMQDCGVGKAARFLLSSESEGLTGVILPVDYGSHIMGP